MRRRLFLIGAGSVGVTVSAGYATLYPPKAKRQMTPPEIFEKLQLNEAILIDVRRPDEWAATGIAKGALPLDLRASNFVDSVRTASLKQPGIPIALICARGVRSRRVSAQLIDAGITNVIDIPEGMLGSSAGPGWLARDLPVTFVQTNS